MIRRSVAVAIAVTFQQLLQGKANDWTFDQSLVLKALRRSDSSLSDATDTQLGAYLREFSEDQLQGIANNVKGQYHELLYEHMENTDGDGETARIFEETNHPGSDIEFLVDGEVVREIQLKAVQDSSSIIEHFEKYPEIGVFTTVEAFEAIDGIYGQRLQSSGLSNEEISHTTWETLEKLSGEDVSDLLQDAAAASLVVGGALQARAILSGEPIKVQEVRTLLELMGVGAGTALTVDALLNLV